MAEYNSRHTGKQIDNGIDTAFSNESKVSALQEKMDMLSINVEAIQTEATNARSVADNAAIKAATAGLRIEEINNALMARIDALEARL